MMRLHPKGVFHDNRASTSTHPKGWPDITTSSQVYRSSDRGRVHLECSDPRVWHSAPLSEDVMVVRNEVFRQLWWKGVTV